MDFNKTLVAAVTLTGLITATSSHAATYAVSYSNITNFGLITDDSASISGFSFSNGAVANDTGDSSATVDFGLIDSNASANCIGDCATLDDSYTSHSAVADFIYADALVDSNNIDAGIGQASSISEAYITSGSAFASSSNSLTGALITVEGLLGADIQFSFDLNNYMEVSGDGTGSAWSSIIMSIDNTVLDWNSPSQLSQSISSGTSTLGTAFTSQFIHLTEGTHSVSISMDNNINVSAVPVPAAVWLFGSGLIGLIGVARRKN